MSIRLIIDSASDIPQKQAAASGMIFLPLTVAFGETEYRDGIDLTSKTFFEKLIETDCLPVTSQIPPYAYEEAFRAVLAAGDTPVAITVSSKLSGTCQSACIAASSCGGKAYVVDSLNVSLGEAILIQYAQRLVETGMDAEALVAALEEARENICVLALLDTLEYLKKGGRISPATALAGGILAIKPVLTLTEGAIILIGKARGSKAGNNLLVEQVKQNGGIDFCQPFALAYSGLTDALLQKYIADSRALWEGQAVTLPTMEIGAAIGTHVGPGTIAVAFFKKKQRNK